MKEKYVIGVDFGTDSCRSLVVDVASGKELATSVKFYPRWRKGLYCNPQTNQYRQHPLDYIECLIASINEAMDILPDYTRERVVGISFDMTSSTPVLTDEYGTPLALLDEYKDNPNAMFILWKDHTATIEAEEINQLARKWEIDYTKYVGGVYSSEWVWAKIIHVLKEDKSLLKKACSWIEHTDWIPALLTGASNSKDIIRSRCTAGHKAMWHESWGGLPSDNFLTTLTPLLTGFRENLYTNTYTSDQKVGTLTPEWASKLGLNTNVSVGVGAIDCHMGAVGANITEGILVKVIGTSTCDIMSVSHKEVNNKYIPGICGQVEGSVIPNMIGLEAGQSAFGDLYAWYKNILSWPLQHILSKSNIIDIEKKDRLIKEVESKILNELTKEAQKIPLRESSVLSTDWMNGRRTPDADQNIKGSITGITLGTTAPMIFKSLVEATAYGSKAIIERLLQSGIEIKEIIAVGGIPQKSPYVMQTLANILNFPIKITKTEQACALGAAMYAAVVAGEYNSILDAQSAMSQGFSDTYYPDAQKVKIYHSLYKNYLKLEKTPG